MNLGNQNHGNTGIMHGNFRILESREPLEPREPWWEPGVPREPMHGSTWTGTEQTWRTMGTSQTTGTAATMHRSPRTLGFYIHANSSLYLLQNSSSVLLDILTK